MKQETILVTGASKGIGRAIAIRLAEAGYQIVVHYGRDEAGAQETLQAVRAAGSDGRIISFDIANRDECRKKLEQDVKEHGAYYGTVLNAAITRDNAFPALEDEDWDDVIDANLGGFYNVLKPLVMPMIRRRAPGRIVVMSSVSGLAGNRGQTNYAATKAGIIAAAKSLAIELAKRKITVNCVAPGVIETEMTKDLPDMVKDQIPMQRYGSPEEVAGVVAFLCSEEASYITRQVISVNGGML
ncbi:3-oxoacyl-ACP reductase FabG [Sneathiella sp. P13V-1]|uniref:3-oxoacyl-ACP reductase FabG n=1 Tax=Sneathiella sp. P13V-1 TaxID=2697366 RepID=UPI00187B7531|nr:3-oxoacyl-ACP reductase FabG [Sneathiella sp. P13V-1]MBE7636509.1 3-oxoacyl-ACP reductase FabG [Sneathiella sp. P13V-1]